MVTDKFMKCHVYTLLSIQKLYFRAVPENTISPPGWQFIFFYVGVVVNESHYGGGLPNPELNSVGRQYNE